MKSLPTCIFIYLILLLNCSCEKREEKPKEVYFTSAFPDREIDLTRKIGNTTTLVFDKDTLIWNITYDPKSKLNFITNKDSDTIVSGKVFKYHKLFFLQQSYSNDKYIISAFRIKRNQIIGLGLENWQMEMIRNTTDEEFGNALNKIRDYSKTPNYVFNTNKKVLYSFYRKIIDSFPPMTIVYYNETDKEIKDSDEEGKFETTLDQENNSMQSKVYPSPFQEQITIETSETDHIISLYNQSNNEIKREHSSKSIHQLSLGVLPIGLYIIKIEYPHSGKIENIKIIKE